MRFLSPAIACLMVTPSNRPTPPEQSWLSPLKQLIPLVESLGDGLRNISLFGLGLSAWFFIWGYFLQHFSLGWALALTAICLLPVLVILRIWWSILSLRRLPELARETVEDAVEDIGDEVAEVVSDLRAQPLQAPAQTVGKALGLLSQAKNLWQMRRLLGEVDDWVAHGLNVGAILNPLSLLLGVVSLLAIGVLA